MDILADLVVVRSRTASRFLVNQEAIPLNLYPSAHRWPPHPGARSLRIRRSTAHIDLGAAFGFSAVFPRSRSRMTGPGARRMSGRCGTCFSLEPSPAGCHSEHSDRPWGTSALLGIKSSLIPDHAYSSGEQRHEYFSVFTCVAARPNGAGSVTLAIGVGCVTSC